MFYADRTLTADELATARTESLNLELHAYEIDEDYAQRAGAVCERRRSLLSDVALPVCQAASTPSIRRATSVRLRTR